MFHDCKTTQRVNEARGGLEFPVYPAAAEAMRKLLEARHSPWGETAPIFCTSEGTMLSRHTWEKRLRGYGDRLGLRIRPYDLRHAFARHYLRNGGHALAI
jgi:site-specific recombinase XerD